MIPCRSALRELYSAYGTTGNVCVLVQCVTLVLV